MIAVMCRRTVVMLMPRLPGDLVVVESLRHEFEDLLLGRWQAITWWRAAAPA